MRRGLKTRLPGIVLTLVVVAALLSPGAHGAEPADSGLWSRPFAEMKLFAERPPETVEESKKIPPAVSMAMLPDGRVIYWGGLEGLEGGIAPAALDGARGLTDSRSRILDLRRGKPRWSTPRPENGGVHDMFCADQRLLANGKLLVVGGTIWRADPIDLREILGPDGPAGGTTELFGSNATRLFDPRTDRWRKGPDFMRHYRWYPTLITLPDGRLFVASGVSRLLYNFRGTTVHQTEIYNPATERWKQTGAPGETQLPLFARLHLLPDGKVFYSGVGQMFNPAGQGYDEALWNVQKIYDPKENAWTMSGMGQFGARSGAFSVMLPLKAPYDEAKFLIGGGTLLTSPGAYVANNFSEIVTVAGGSSSSERTPDMVNQRWYSSGVLLPDGSVVALSGANRDEVLIPGSETPVTQAEIFDGESWKPLASGERVRTYHNTAMLLPDGSILVGGHSPINTGYGATGDNSAQQVTGTNNLKDPSFEIFKPPYLFRGTRPRITRVDSGLAWKQDFAISTPDAGRVAKVVLMRLPTVTHITDADQRSIELDFKVNKPGLVSVTAPPSGNVAPPGYYYLFILTDTGEGLTPSNARIVRVGPRPDARPAPAPMGM